MIAILYQLTPIFFFFLVGLLLRYKGLADRSHGEFLLRLVFFVTLPLLILTTLPQAELSLDKAILPLANIVVNVLCMSTTLLLARGMQLSRAVTGSMLMNTMIANNAFMFPFILVVYGESGFADAILFDFGNAIMVATVTYTIAFRYGSGEQSDSWAMLRRVLTSPLFIALAVGLVLSLSGNGLPVLLDNMAEPLAQMTAPLILVALGIYFSLQLQHLKLVGLALTIRMLLGFTFGFLFAKLVGLEGPTLVVVALCSGGPIGFMALTFSSMAKLDVELTTTAVSLSILIGLFWVPLLIFLFGTA